MLSPALFGSVLWFALAFLLVLSVLVIIHELGHYLVARYYGVKVAAFSVGFGPELYHRIDKNGCRWRIAAIPLGGYVKWVDDENGASMPDREAIARMSPQDRAGSFHAKPVGQRAAIVAAGPIANFLLALVLFTGFFWWNGDFMIPAKIGKVVENSAGEAAGLKAGDVIVSIDKTPVSTFDDLSRIVTQAAGQTLALEIDRGNQRLTIQATPRMVDQDTGFGRKMKVGRLGLALPPRTDWEKRYYSLPGAVWRATTQGTQVIVDTTAYLWKVLTFQTSGDQISGVLGIAAASGTVASLGIVEMIIFLAAMSVNLGFANLLPIPVLDGGHLVFYAFEKLKGAPLSERTQEYAFRFGITLLLFLFVYALFNDVTGIDWRSVLKMKTT